MTRKWPGWNVKYKKHGDQVACMLKTKYICGHVIQSSAIGAYNQEAYHYASDGMQAKVREHIASCKKLP